MFIEGLIHFFQAFRESPMTHRVWLVLTTMTILLVLLASLTPVNACCPVWRSGQPVVNADQTVVILWDAATKTEHFIRKASFKSQADDFGFLVPTPSQPELDESGNDAFPYLQKLTEPEVQRRSRPSGMGCGCGTSGGVYKAVGAANKTVTVLEEKLVAGFNATVLEADSAEALVQWLKQHDYAFSPEVEAWAKPYVDGCWKFTALKVAKTKDTTDKGTVAASALRISFKTDQPLFPYREPDFREQAKTLGATRRLLRIYFIGDTKYQGGLTKDVNWTGKVAWANKLAAADRKKTLELLKLPEHTGPTEWWMTEFEDAWPYQVAPADVYFARAGDQNTVERPPIIEYVSTAFPSDGAVYALAAIVIVPVLIRRYRRR
jgi:hypothetical protein